jgi:hypothetical protein
MGKNILILGISFIVVMLVLIYSRAQMILRTWAKDNGYEILSSNMRFLSRGPYKYTLLGKQWVFHVVVRASDGSTKTGYVKCGSFFWGVFVNSAEARLDR